MGFTAAINVSAGASTSSPRPTPAMSMARCRPEVPLLQATARGMWVYSAIFSSNSDTLLPPVDTHSLITASFTYCFSLPEKFGTDSGINCWLIYFASFLYKNSGRDGRLLRRPRARGIACRGRLRFCRPRALRPAQPRPAPDISARRPSAAVRRPGTTARDAWAGTIRKSRAVH